MLQFKKGKSYLKIENPTSKGLTIKAGTALGCVNFKLIRDLSQCANTITHLHQDIDGSSAMCSLSRSACTINHALGIDPHIAHSRTCQKAYNHTPQSLDYLSRKSAHVKKKSANIYRSLQFYTVDEANRHQLHIDYNPYIYI